MHGVINHGAMSLVLAGSQRVGGSFNVSGHLLARSSPYRTRPGTPDRYPRTGTQVRAPAGSEVSAYAGVPFNPCI